ncbi:MAG TPA: hypothetical protein VFJ97_02805 [Dermatophilaceae bacterium]|nr:hypothetical protein [Dermatophilaceae bacterium]
MSLLTPAKATAPEAPGRLGVALQPAQLLRYLEALGRWRDQRRAELDRLDQAAQAATPANASGDQLTADILLSMALWKAVADRHDLLLASWDSGRVGPVELERLSTLVWGRLDATLEPNLAARAGTVVNQAGALSLSLPEACRLSDALAGSLRARLGIDADAEDTAQRVRELRAAVERIRDLVDREPARSRAAAADTLQQLDRRVTDVTERARRGADVGGLLGPLDADTARAERDLIVAAANRVDAARDMALARAQRGELQARGCAVRALAARCVAEVEPAPRLAVPDVAALGPVPDDPAALGSYLTRLGAVSRALGQAQTAYQSAIDERDELAGRLEGYAAKVAAQGQLSTGARGDLDEMLRRARAVFATRPTDLSRARALVAAYQAFLTASGGHP